MSTIPVKEYVDHLFASHKRSGTIQPALEKLRNDLRAEAGDYQLGQRSEKPLQFSAWCDLQYVEGFLETNAAKGADCVACLKDIKR